jgi:hypothetical protein
MRDVPESQIKEIDQIFFSYTEPGLKLNAITD